jgi:4-amino-4-deoxy-L-arabinose transferase-like glycosyltransferase
VSRLVLPVRRLLAALGRIPRAGRACFLVALVNAFVWGLIVPPFHVPDENSHFAYAQYLAETGKPPPQGSGSSYSPQEVVALTYLHFYETVGDPRGRGILTPAENRALRSALATHPSPRSGGGPSSATNQPPLYYALAAIPYWLSPSHDILGRLAVMRLLSALLAAATVLTVFLFLRELLPGSSWAPTAGALMVAFQPMVGFIAAGVQGDNLLYLASALTFLALTRAYRQGLTRRRALAIGAATAVGLLTKLTFLALVPGIALALLLVGWRALPEGRLRALRLTLTAVAVAAVPLLAYGLLNLTVWHRGTALAAGTVGATNSSLPHGGTVTLGQSLAYTWQLYLPRLPFMSHDYFPSGSPVVHVWFDGLVGRFGWLDYTFPGWVYTLGESLLVPLLALALIGVVRVRAAVLRVLPLFACFGVMALGLLAAVGYAGIRYQLSTGSQFAQARYLFPLLALYALFIALVARGAGRRWAPAAAAALVLLAMAHDLFAQTLTISRYYG